MVTIERKKLEQLLEALNESWHLTPKPDYVRVAIAASKEALAQPAQEPVSCNSCKGSGWVVRDPDIGTDQECFVCQGSGMREDEAQPAQEEECKHQFQVDQDAPKHKCCQICGLVVGSSAQPAQEPEPDELTLAIVYMSGLLDGKKKRPWVGLNDEEREEIENRPFSQNDWLWSYACAIESALKQKNT